MSRRRDRHDVDYREPEALTVAFEAVERAQREADRGFRAVLELLNPPRDESHTAPASARR